MSARRKFCNRLISILRKQSFLNVAISIVFANQRRRNCRKGSPLTAISGFFQSTLSMRDRSITICAIQKYANAVLLRDPASLPHNIEIRKRLRFLKKPDQVLDRLK